MSFLGFCIFMSVFVYCDHKQFIAGYDTFFYKHKTEEEKELRSAVIAKAKRDAA